MKKDLAEADRLCGNRNRRPIATRGGNKPPENQDYPKINHSSRLVMLGGFAAVDFPKRLPALIANRGSEHHAGRDDKALSRVRKSQRKATATEATIPSGNERNCITRASVRGATSKRHPGKSPHCLELLRYEIA